MNWLLVLILSFPLFAQEVKSISGRLVEKGTRKPLQDVSIFVLPYKLKAVTSESGDFLLENVPVGECTIIINLTGYEKLEKKLECGQIQSFNFYLEKKFYTSFETTVTSKVTKRDDQTQSLTQEEFIKAPGSFGGDPVRAAQNLPGVAATSGTAQIVVQGASPEDTGYLINGHRVPLVFHFGGLSSVIIPEGVERVDLLPSGYGPEYSRALGGIIGLTTKSPKVDRTHGMAYVDLLNVGGLVEGPINNKSSYFFSARYSYIGQVLKAVSKGNEDFEFSSAPTYYDVTSIYKLKVDDKNDFKTTFVLSKDSIVSLINKPINNDTKLRGDLQNTTEFFRIQPQMLTRFSEKHKMDNSLSLGKDSIFFNISGKYLDVDSDVISQRSEFVSEWTPTYKTYIGLDNQWNHSKVGVNLPTSFEVGGVQTPFSVGNLKTFETQRDSTLLGAYIRQEIKTSEDSQWTYLPNIRVDHFTLTQESFFEPRFQIRKQQTPSLQFRGAWGKYVQPPLPQETSPYFGNSSLNSPYAYHYMLGYSKDFREGATNGLEWTNNFFYKELKDLVLSDVRARFKNSGSGTIVGGEVQAKYRKNEWTSQVVYTYLKSTRNVPGYGSQPSEFDQTHNLNLIGSYRKEKWTFGGRFRFVSGLPYTPVIGGTFDSDNDVYIPIRGSIYSQRFDAFKQLDIRIDRNFIYEKWILTAYLDIQNILNSKNPSSIDYSYDFSQSKKMSGLPILPTFGVKGTF